MKKLLVFPTWVLTGLLRPFFPADHAWKGKRFTLKDWADNSTRLTKQFSIFFWMAGVFLIEAAYFIYSLITK